MPHTEVYNFTKTPSGIIYPFIPIGIVHPKDTNKVCMEMTLVDTGADHCLFHKNIPAALGYNLLDGRFVETKGVSSDKVNTWWHPFRIFLFSNDRKKIVWRSKECEIGCLDHDSTPPLLGTVDFLYNFKVVFNYPTKKLLIEIP